MVEIHCNPTRVTYDCTFVALWMEFIRAFEHDEKKLRHGHPKPETAELPKIYFHSLELAQVKKDRKHKRR